MIHTLTRFGVLAVICLLALAPSSFGQTAYPSSFSQFWEFGIAVLPASLTSVCGSSTVVPCGATVHIDALVLVNTTAGTATVTVTDGSTNCAGAACQIFPTVTVQGNTVYTVNLLGVAANGGIKWQASSANAVQGYLRGKV